MNLPVLSMLFAAALTLESTVPQEVFSPTVDELVRAAQDSADADRPQEAALRFHQAARAAAMIGDPDQRKLEQKRVAKLAKKVDKDFATRRKMEEKAAEEFTAVARKYIRDDMPLTALHALQYAGVFDPGPASDARTLAQGMEPGDGDQERATRYAEYSEQMLSDSAVDAIAKEDRHFPALVRARESTARAAMKVATNYARRGWHEVAYDVALMGRIACNNLVTNEVEAIKAELVDHQALVFYETIAKDAIDRTLEEHRKVGPSKGWKLAGNLISMPPPSEDLAILVSQEILSGNYSVQVEFKFPELSETAQLVFAYADEGDYCMLEYTRSRGNTSVALIHVQNGDRQVLHGVRGEQLPEGWHPLRVEVRGGTITGICAPSVPQPHVPFGPQKASPWGPLVFNGVQVSAALPAVSSEGGAFGVARSGSEPQKRKPKAEPVILYRNLYAAPLE